ncbi:MAG: glycosyltransferase, partial [Sphingobacteriales bacterium]
MLISLVIPALNRPLFLEKTLHSIFNQITDKEFELIIIDTFEKFINSNPIKEAKTIALTELAALDKSLVDLVNTLLTKIVTNPDLNTVVYLPNLNNETRFELSPAKRSAKELDRRGR